MVFTEKLIGQARPADTSIVTVFTATTKTIIKSIRVANTSSDEESFSIYIVPSGATVGDIHKIYGDVLLHENTTIGDDGYFVLDTGDSIQVSVGTGDKISFTFMGAEL